MDSWLNGWLVGWMMARKTKYSAVLRQCSSSADDNVRICRRLNIYFKLMQILSFLFLREKTNNGEFVTLCMTAEWKSCLFLEPMLHVSNFLEGLWTSRQVLCTWYLTALKIKLMLVKHNCRSNETMRFSLTFLNISRCCQDYLMVKVWGE